MTTVSGGRTADTHGGHLDRRFAALSDLALPLIFVLLLLGFSLWVPHFATWANFGNVLQRNAIIGIVACGIMDLLLKIGEVSLDLKGNRDGEAAAPVHGGF